MRTRDLTKKRTRTHAYISMTRVTLKIDELLRTFLFSLFSHFQSKECVELREFTIKKKKGILCGGTPAKTNNTNTHAKKELTSKRVDLMTYAAA